MKCNLQTKSLEIFYEFLDCTEENIIQNFEEKFFIKSYGADIDRRWHVEIE